MRKNAVLAGAVLCGCLWASAATTRYVVTPGTPGVTPTTNYTSWATAATNIQQAIDVAATDDLILVTNGTYYLSSQLILAKAVTLRSFKDGMTDREGTVLDGGFPATTNRCVLVTNAVAVIDSFTITNGYASTNSMLGYGGGFYLYSKGLVTNCVIAGNQAEARGGGGYLISTGDCQVVGSLIAGNSCWTNTVTYGGGIASYKSVIRACTIRGNSARAGGGVYMAAGGNADGNGLMTDCLVEENTARVLASATDGGGGVCMFYKGTVANCSIISNRTAVSAGSGYAAGVTVGEGGVLRDSLVAYNTGASYGGGAMGGVLRTITNCVFYGNSASYGGGAYCSGGLFTHCTVMSNSSAAFVQGKAVLRNCLFANNSEGVWANSGGGGTYQNCTIVSNAGTGLQIGQGANVITGTVENCIVYYNRVTNYSKTAAASIVFTNCCTVPLPGGTYDLGNIATEPAFVSVPARNYRLTWQSPCIDAGVFSAWMTGAKDLDGAPRVIGKAVDLGAYECPPNPGTLICVF